jgi:hypothetical protein
MREIEPRAVTVAAGLETYSTADPYMGEFIYAYGGYAINDWAEAGIALHTYPSSADIGVDARVDLVDAIWDVKRLSLLLMGGVGGFVYLMPQLIFHGGVAVTYRGREWWEIYVGAGSDSVSRALVVQAGACMTLFSWFGLSVSGKAISGPLGRALVVSFMPFLIFRRADGSE